MTKLLAIIKREYLQRVRTKMFVVMTILGPVLLVVFTIVPGLLFSMKAGGATRIAIVDQTPDARLFKPLSDAFLRKPRTGNNSGSSAVETINANTRDRAQSAGKALSGNFAIDPMLDMHGRSLDQAKRELNERIAKNQLDGYLIIPADILTNNTSRPEYYGRNVGDVITSGQIEDRIDRVVRTERLIAAGVKEQSIEALSRPVDLATYPVNDKGEVGAKDSGAGFLMVFIIGFLIYITIIMYGQVILGAVVEEKETRIAEMLFSSVRSFPLMMGKLIGVSLVALTQLAIWFLAFAVFTVYGISALAGGGSEGINVPHLPPVFVVYFFLFFVLGYFIYATVYALVGSMVTTTQEGGQVAMPVLLLLMSGFYMAFPVIRSPNSSFAFWVSMVPFFSPITMIVRILSQTPPFWQIALSLGIGFATVVLLTWLAARIYRIGMLMYGKRATIPEVWRWLRQA